MDNKADEEYMVGVFGYGTNEMGNSSGKIGSGNK